MPAVIGEYVDRLCSIELRPGSGNAPRGTIHRQGLNVGAGLASAVELVAMPLEAAACEAQAQELLDGHSPSAVVAIEKLSPNRAGLIHGATGLNLDDAHGKPQFLFAEARRRGILTCGIGDGGNEVGFGAWADAVAEIMPAGRVCQCGCGAGTAASVETDRFLVAAISNWGACGVAALISYLTGDERALTGPEELERMLRASVDAGALDGMFATPVLADDGVPLEAILAFATLLRSSIRIGRSQVQSPGH